MKKLNLFPQLKSDGPVIGDVVGPRVVIGDIVGPNAEIVIGDIVGPC